MLKVWIEWLIKSSEKLTLHLNGPSLGEQPMQKFEVKHSSPVLQQSRAPQLVWIWEKVRDEEEKGAQIINILVIHNINLRFYYEWDESYWSILSGEVTWSDFHLNRIILAALLKIHWRGEQALEQRDQFRRLLPVKLLKEIRQMGANHVSSELIKCFVCCTEKIWMWF